MHAIRVDVTDRAAMSAACLETEKVFGNVHVLVNNAGIGIQGPFNGVTYEDWDFGLAVNLGGVINGLQTFLGLLDAIVDRTADILERTAAEVEVQSRAIFGRPRGAAFEQILNRLGRAQNVNSKARDSLVSLARLLSFAALAEQFGGSKDLRDHLKSLQRDVQSITDHSSYLAGNITFLLDAALGQINIEQNAILKVFSVFTVALLPPTLIGAIYGMNFRHMPELGWPLGYPMALGLMAISAIAPLLWFKRRGWL